MSKENRSPSTAQPTALQANASRPIAWPPITFAKTPQEAIAAGTCGENLHWILDAGGTLTISGKGEMPSFSRSSDGLWKKYAENIRTVIIGDGVTSIGENAFSGCINLTRVSIPDSVTRIEASAFGGCYDLTDIFSTVFTDSKLFVAVKNIVGPLISDDWNLEGLIYFIVSALGWKNMTIHGGLDREYTTYYGECSQGKLEVGNDYIGDGYVEIDFKSPNKNSFTLQSFRELLERFKTFFLNIRRQPGGEEEYIHKISEKLNMTEFELR